MMKTKLAKEFHILLHFAFRQMTRGRVLPFPSPPLVFIHLDNLLPAVKLGEAIMLAFEKKREPTFYHLLFSRKRMPKTPRRLRCMLGRRITLSRTASMIVQRPSSGRCSGTRLGSWGRRRSSRWRRRWATSNPIPICSTSCARTIRDLCPRKLGSPSRTTIGTSFCSIWTATCNEAPWWTTMPSANSRSKLFARWVIKYILKNILIAFCYRSPQKSCWMNASSAWSTKWLPLTKRRKLTGLPRRWPKLNLLLLRQNKYNQIMDKCIFL